MYLIFKGSEFHLAIGVVTKNYLNNSDYTVIQCEEYDASYSYSLVNGEVVKGDLIELDPQIDLDWEQNKYKIERKNEYPSFAEQLDYIYHNGLDAWKSDIVDPIKAKYPKPNTEE
jgi:hypothetical protein